jgi:hypothetical protein
MVFSGKSEKWKGGMCGRKMKKEERKGENGKRKVKFNGNKKK